MKGRRGKDYAINAARAGSWEAGGAFHVLGMMRVDAEQGEIGGFGNWK